jgi:enoyl-CoA hydratase/carnithine racemase
MSTFSPLLRSPVLVSVGGSKEIAHMNRQLTYIVTLNRPKALNALCSPLFTELNDALSKYDSDKDIGAIIITGSEKAFAGT